MNKRVTIKDLQGRTLAVLNCSGMVEIGSASGCRIEIGDAPLRAIPIQRPDGRTMDTSPYPGHVGPYGEGVSFNDR